MKAFKRVSLGVALVPVLLIWFGSTSYATFELMLSDGNPSDTVTIVDGSAPDSNPTTGAITWIGTMGTWTISVTTALGYPAVGTLTQPVIDISSIDATSTSGGTLTISASETGFSPTSTVSGTFMIGGTTSGTVQASVYGNSSNASFGTGTLLASLSGSTGAFSGVTSGSFTPGSTYSLTEITAITQNAAGMTSLDASFAVPEPATILFLGLGMVGAAMYGRYSRRGRESA